MRFLIAILIVVCVLALAATFGAIFVGIRSFDGLVVEHPYETGLKWDEMQARKAGLNGAGTPAACDIQRAPCRRETAGGLSVTFDIAPKPVTTMSEIMFSVALTRQGKPVADASSVILDLSMPGMFMGKNRPVLTNSGDGRYQGRGMIPRCVSGEKTWRAEVAVAHGGKTEVADFVFEVK